MNRFFRCITLMIMLTACVVTSAQTAKWQDMHKVKKSETIYGIAHQYGITEEELIGANPEMKSADYKLKKGSYLWRPYHRADVKPSEDAVSSRTVASKETKKSKVSVGVLLPLHDEDGDGRRMVEFYRGVLMACDSLKREGISVDIHTWNVPIDADIRQFLLNEQLQSCDVIFGPLYSSQTNALANYAKSYDIKLVIPFSTSSMDVYTNANVYQVYQPANDFNANVIAKFTAKFAGYHPIFIDCNDSLSSRGSFTSELRRQLDVDNVTYNLTNLQSGDLLFSKAFSRSKPNVIILNSASLKSLNIALAKLNTLTVNVPGLVISLFGYTEWQTYTAAHLDEFYKYDTYIPTTFYRNPLSTKVGKIEKQYRWWFKGDMMQTFPRFALTGFDYGYFFIRGISLYGSRFTGARGTVGYTPLQSPLCFERIGVGGYLNRSLMFIHYNYNH